MPTKNKKVPAKYVKKNSNRLKIKLEEVREKIMQTSFHHLQTETTVKQFFYDLIEVLKKEL